MSSIDIASLLAPIEEDQPCGPNLAYEAPYLELEMIAQGTPERQMGDAVIPAEEPNWKLVRDRSIELLGRTKDLQLIIHLAVALVETDGLQGLRDGLAVLCESLERYWDQIYPQLDPEDDNDPLQRMNIVVSLCDQDRFLRRVRAIPLTNSPRAGRLSLRDIAIASGEIAPTAGGDEEGAPGPDMALVEAAFEDTEVDELTEFTTIAEEARVLVLRLDQYLIETVGAGGAPDLSELNRVLGDIVAQLRGQLERRGVGIGGGGTEASEGASEAAEGPGAPSGEIRSREDVIRALDRVCRYYEAKEPSSPIPLLLRRAQRLVAKSFVEIVRDLTPGAISEVETIGGEDYSTQE